MKLKVRHEGAFVIGGIVGGRGAFRGVVVGTRAGRRIVYRGTIEYGFTRASVADLFDSASGLSRVSTPFADYNAAGVAWLEPRLSAIVSYSELMEGWLRDPMYRGIVARP